MRIVIKIGKERRKHMLNIGKTYFVRKNNNTRLCADITMDNRMITLWYSVKTEQEKYLALGKADAFVLAILPLAMREKHNIVCEDVISERLYYQLTSNYIPTFAYAGTFYNEIEIKADVTNEKYPNENAVGTGFSAGVDSLYTIMKYNGKTEYPLTHIAVFNSGFFEGNDYDKGFQNACEMATKFANEQKLKTVFLNTNFNEVLPERFLDVYSFRNVSCALALQGLFSKFLLSSGSDAGNFKIDFHNSADFDLLTVAHVNTESLAFYSSGSEVTRIQKIEALTNYKPSYKWLHPCFHTSVGQMNCGHCKKDCRDQAVLFALGKLDLYKNVYDIEDFKKHFAERLAVLKVHCDVHFYADAWKLLEEKNVKIPEKTYTYEKQFKIAMKNLKKKNITD